MRSDVTFTDIVEPDGNLYYGGRPYIDWEKGEETVHLDGYFTVEYLEFILYHMKKHSNASTQG